MKKILRTATILALFTLLSTNMFAQQNETEAHPTPKWISDKGYWVIESNIKTPDTCMIHFYNNDNIRMYSERVEGITLNLEKRKTRMRLKKALDQSLLAWQQSHWPKDNVQVVKNIFKR